VTLTGLQNGTALARSENDAYRSSPAWAMTTTSAEIDSTSGHADPTRRPHRGGSQCPIGDAVSMRSPDTTPTQGIVRLVGVYGADSTLRGELSYWVGARLGRRHCSLCDITHGSVRQRPEWKTCQASLPMPFDTYHRNDQPDPIRAAAGGQAPVVIAETDTGHVVLLAAAELEACAGSIDRLVEAIERSALSLGLTWPSP
jgi:hypothetical protein